MTLARVVTYLGTNLGIMAFTVWLEPLRLAFKDMKRREAIACAAIWAVVLAAFWFWP